VAWDLCDIRVVLDDFPHGKSLVKSIVTKN